MNLPRKENSPFINEYYISDNVGSDPFIIHYSFLDKKQPFLKKGIDLFDEFQGTSLDELISLKSTEFDGVVLDQEQIPIITNNIYESLLSQKYPKLRIKNSSVLAFLYTLCKIDDIVLFQVWKINTQKVNETRNDWEAKYKIERGDCCRFTYFSRAKEQLKYTFDDEDFLKYGSVEKVLVEKNCLYKTPYVDCGAVFRSHFFNYENKKANQSFKEKLFSISIAKDFNFGNCFGNYPFFCHGGLDSSSFLTCTCFYDSIVFENTPENTRERNFQSFLFNALSTCYSAQNKIKSFPISSQENQHRLLFVSLYFDLE